MNDQSPETIFSLLADRAAASPDSLALIANQRGRWVTTSAQQLVDRVAALALALSKLGIAKGDRVAILLANDPEWLVIDLAAQVIGAVSVAVPSHSDPEALTATLQELGVIAVVSTDAVEADRLNILAEQSHLESIEHVFHLGASEQGSEGLDDAIARGTRTLAENPTALSELLEAEDSSLQATITFTSGSRGHSSRVVHTGAALLDHAKEVGESFAMSPSDVTVVSMDPSHPFERTVTMYPALVTGAVLAFPEDESTIDRALHEVRPTFAHLPADVVRAAAASVHSRFRRNRGFKRLLSLWWTRSTLKAVRSGKEPSAISKMLVGRHILRSLGWNNLRYLLVTGETVPVEVLSTLLAIGLPVRSGYVVVEAGLVAVGDPKDGWGLPATQGVTVGQFDGQLVVSGKGMGVGYADGSALALDDEGALITGDLGRVDDGLVHVQGPAASQIDLEDGRRLIAAEIERSLRDSQYIALAAVRLDAGVLRVDIEIDRDTVSDWAASRSLQFTTFSSLVELDEVKSLVAGEVARFAADVAHHDLLGTPLQQGRDITRTGRTIYRGFSNHDQGVSSPSPENNESAPAVK